MAGPCRRYDCAKPLVLGALYDALEALQWKLVFADSAAGLLIASEYKTGLPFLVRIGAGQGDGVKVTVECASGVHAGKEQTESAARCLLQTLDNVIEKALHSARQE